MGNIEILEKWTPIDIEFDADDLLGYKNYGSEGLVIELVAFTHKEKYKNKVMRIFFKYQPQAFRVYNSWQGWSKMYDKIFSQTKLSNWSLYKMKNSNFIDWYENERYIASKNKKLIDFLILTEDSVVQVISDIEPEVTIYDKN